MCKDEGPLLFDNPLSVTVPIIDGVDNFELVFFWVVFVCHVAGDNTINEIFVDASGGGVVDFRSHALHKTLKSIYRVGTGTSNL